MCVAFSIDTNSNDVKDKQLCSYDLITNTGTSHDWPQSINESRKIHPKYLEITTNFLRGKTMSIFTFQETGM